MDASQTVFYLGSYSNNEKAQQIIDDSTDRLWVDRNNPARRLLRVGLDQISKTPSQLVRFGRNPRNDVILKNTCFSRNDQCYFDFNTETGALILHDISQNGDTDIFAIEYDGNGKAKVGKSQIWKSPRQCVVVLDEDMSADGPLDQRYRQWLFKMRGALFLLIPSQTASLEERLTFARQPDPDRTVEGTTLQFNSLGLQSLQGWGLATTYASSATINPHNTRFCTKHQPEAGDEIRYTKLRLLGRGGQGQVYEVVDNYTGAHYACKIIAVKDYVPEWGIHSEKDFRARVQSEVNLVRDLRHPHIVPYLHTQGFKIGDSIQLLMPNYEPENLGQLLERLRHECPGSVPDIARRMLMQILSALDYVHTRGPPVIHRDVKPSNILYKAENFFLSDFGIAKTLDQSNTIVGSQWHMAPEIRQKEEQTTKVDIWGLGVTVVECLVGLPSERERAGHFMDLRQWYEYIQAQLKECAPRLQAMLNLQPDLRPAARDILPVLEHFCNVGSGSVPPKSAPASCVQENWTKTMLTSMDWTQAVATTFFRGNPQLPQGSGEGKPVPRESTQTKKPPSATPSEVRRRGTRRGQRRKCAPESRSKVRGGDALPSRSAPSRGVSRRYPARRGRTLTPGTRRVREMRILQVV